MGLFSFFNKRNINKDNSLKNETLKESEIPKDIFIEEENPKENQSNDLGIYQIYEFLEINFEPKGHDDASRFFDTSNKLKGIESIKLQFKNLANKIENNIEKQILELESKIESGKENGFSDLVKRLEVQKKILKKDNIKIEKMLKNIDETCKISTSSYEKGFDLGIFNDLNNR